MGNFVFKICQSGACLWTALAEFVFWFIFAVFGTGTDPIWLLGQRSSENT